MTLKVLRKGNPKRAGAAMFRCSCGCIFTITSRADFAPLDHLAITRGSYVRCPTCQRPTWPEKIR